MSQQTNVFLATPDALRLCFPDFRAARTEPIVREGKNPRTGETLRIENWDPGSEADPADFSDTQGRPEQASAVPLAADHESFMRGVSPLVRTFPHYPFFNLMFTELDQRLVGPSAHPDCFFWCANPDEYVQVLSHAATEVLASATADNFPTIATQIYPHAPPSSEPDSETAELMHRIASKAIEAGCVVCLHGSL